MTVTTHHYYYYYYYQVMHEEGLPPTLLSIDHVHGANYIMGATIFPHQINLAATFNREYAHHFGRITGQEEWWRIKETSAFFC